MRVLEAAELNGGRRATVTTAPFEAGHPAGGGNVGVERRERLLSGGPVALGWGKGLKIKLERNGDVCSCLSRNGCLHLPLPVSLSSSVARYTINIVFLLYDKYRIFPVR